MVRLGSTDRARLPDRAFAYIDSQGRRRLPIHDASHVRNALARFNQVRFEDDAARDRARTRLLVAAKRAIPSMQRQGGGNIVVIGATASRRGAARAAAFAPASCVQVRLNPASELDVKCVVAAESEPALPGALLFGARQLARRGSSQS